MVIKVKREDFRWTNGRGHDQKPVLYSQKANTYGLGKKEHSADQWWLNAFDTQLKSLDVSKTASGEVKVKQTEKATPLGATKANKFYIRFVKGGLLTGSIERPAMEEVKELKDDTATPETSDEELRVRRQEKAWRRSERQEKRDKKRGKKEVKKQRMQKEKDREETKEERRERKRIKRLVEKELAGLQATS